MAVAPKARIIGLVYLLYFLTAVASVVVVQGIVVAGDSAATARNILAHQGVFQLGAAIGLISTALYVAMTALFYGLFRPVDESMSLLAAFFGLVGCAVQAVGMIFRLSALVVLRGDATLSSFTVDQVRGLALLVLRLKGQADSVSLVFFGLYCLTLGYLMVRAAFLPKALGVLMVLAGLGWLTALAPPLAASLARYVQPIGFVAEMSLMVWLLVKGD